MVSEYQVSQFMKLSIFQIEKQSASCTDLVDLLNVQDVGE